MPLAEFRAGIAAPEQRLLLEYWLSLRQGRAMPSRADFDPTRVPQALKNIGLLDVIDGGRNFRFRLVGTAIEQRADVKLTGKLVTEAQGNGPPDFFFALYRLAMRTRRAVRASGRASFDRGLNREVCRIYMPLSPDDRTVDMLLYTVMPIGWRTVQQDGRWAGSLEFDKRVYICGD